MRTDTEVEGREVLAVWMKGALKYVSQTSYPILYALKATDGGRTQIKRDFLCDSSDATCIKKKENSVRQSCITLFLDTLPASTKEKLKEGMQYQYFLHACYTLGYSLQFTFQLLNKERRQNCWYSNMDLRVQKLKLRSILHACLNQAIVKNNQ